MVNFGLNPASFLGILLAVAGAGLYFLRSMRPELSRDQDIAFSAIGILCGFILIFQGWRLDPILQFGQFLISGSAIFFAYENIKLRGIATEQAKENTRIVDDERPVSRRYKAEIEDREYLEDRPRNSRRIKGDRDRNEDDREERPRRRSVTRELPEDRFANEAPPRRRRDAPERTQASSLARRAADSWDGDEEWEESNPRNSRRALPDADATPQPPRRSVRREPRDVPPDPMNDRGNVDRQRSAQEDDFQPDPGSRRRRSRSTPNEEQPIASAEGTTASYVDYEPIDDPQSGLPPSGTEPIVFPDRY